MLAKDLTELISPKFTEQVLHQILENKTCLKNIQIQEIQMGAESKKGDSYLSTICRFSVKATGINASGEQEYIFLPIITKAVPKNVARRKTFLSADFFETEIYFYEKVWPMLLELKKSKNVPGIDEVPLVLASHFDEDCGYIALEDLSYKNFGGIERSGSGLDYSHAVSLLQLLAKFHALSLACKDQNPKFEAIAAATKETYFAERYRNWYKGFAEKLFDLFRYAVEKELPPIYLTKLNKLLDTDLYKALCDFCVIRNEFSVVTQGDAWLPNFLVRYVDGKNIPEESVLIDFQLARYTTLSNDISFFLYACVAEDVLVENWNNLIKEYHTALVERLSELGTDPNLITLDALYKDIQKNALFGIGMGMEAITMSLLAEDEVSDLDLIQGEEAVPIDSVWYVPLFKDAERRKRIAFIIKHGVDNGFIQ